MGWPTKTNCSPVQPTLGNPASLLPYVYRPPALTQRERDAFCNLLPAPVPVPAPPPAPVPVPSAVDIPVTPATEPTLAATIDSCLTPAADTVDYVAVDTANAPAPLTYAQLVADICTPHLSLSLPSLCAVSNAAARTSNTSHVRTAHQHRSTGATTFSTVLQHRASLRPAHPHTDAPSSSHPDRIGDSFSKSDGSTSGSHRAHPPPRSAHRGASSHIPP